MGRLSTGARLKRVAFVGTYLPRQCGIATFTADLCHAVRDEALDLICYAIPVNDSADGYDYPPEDKDAALFPRRIGGRWALIHRPVTAFGAHIWLSYSPDLRHWGSHKLILEARRGAWWDANKIGLSPPPIETEEGWLLIYHGVRQTAGGCIYRLGLALLDLENPERCLLRGSTWVFSPVEHYEREGDVDNVVFPCGYVLDPDGDTLRLYYGAADTSVALATASVRTLLDWLHHNGSAQPYAEGS